MKTVNVRNVRIYINPNLKIEHKVNVERSLRERLLTFPWRPMVRYRTVVKETPYKDALAMNVNGAPALMMHPATFDKFQQQLPTGSVHETEDSLLPKARPVALADDHHERHHCGIQQ